MRNKLSFLKAALQLSLSCLMLLIISNPVSANVGDYDYPVKSMTYWTNPRLNLSDLENLSKHDILVVDLENKFNNYQFLLALKKLNPKLKLVCYSNPMEIFLTKYHNRSWQNKIIDEITANRQAWLLKTITPTRAKSTSLWERLKAWILNKPTHKEDYAVFWNGMIMLNMSTTCPKINGETYSNWIVKKLLAEVLSDPIWDGYFMDNGTPNISWTHPGKLDIDGDKKADNDIAVDRSWKQGMENYLLQIRRDKGQQFVIISNKGDLSFSNVVEGKFFEKFPNDYLGDKWAGGWRQCMQNAAKTGKYTIFQANRADLPFVLASALLLDNVYISVSQDDAGYFKTLEMDPGRPLGPQQNKNGIYYRDYENAEIMVDPLKKIAKITMK